MNRHLHIIIFILIFFLATAVNAQNRRGNYRAPIPNHSFAKTNSAGYAKAMKRGRNRGFGRGNPGSGITNSYANLHRSSNGFGQGSHSSMPSGKRHSMSLNRQKKFLWIFPSHRKFYRGHRSALGIFKSK